jgi:MGT family glycosyltransferase
MAHFAILSMGLSGHVNPTLPLVRELVRRGHVVTYYAPEPFRAAISARGARFESYHSVYMEPVPGLATAYSVDTMPARFIRELRHVLPQVLERMRNLRPDVIGYDMFGWAGRCAATLLGIPAARFAPTYVMNDHFPLDPASVWAAPAIGYFYEEASAFAREFDLPAPDIRASFQDCAQLNVVFLPREFQPMGDRFDERYLFVGSSAAAERSAARARRPSLHQLYISRGTIFNDESAFLERCYQAFGHTEWQVMVSAGNRVPDHCLTNAPSNFSVHREVDQISVLRNTDVFVTHGGMNSIMEALSLAVPLVVCPQMFEQAVNAGRVVELEAGLATTSRLPAAEELKDLVYRVNESSAYRRGAERMANHNRRAGGCERAAQALESLLS